MFGDYASNLMFLPNPTRRELLHFVAGGGFNRICAFRRAELLSRYAMDRIIESNR